MVSLAFLSAALAVPNTPEGQSLAQSKVPVKIADGGKALLSIVVSPESSDAMKQTAAELAGYLKRMTGAEVVVEQSNEAKGITLGTLQQFPDEELKGPLAIKQTYDGLEAYAIRSDEGRIRLLGNTDLGASHAAYRFLELLGCRWFFPGSHWEIIPHSPHLEFALNEASRPAIWTRIIGIGRSAESEPGEPNVRTTIAPWYKENLVGQSLKVTINHQWGAISTVYAKGFYKKQFADHPEYFALVKGKRTAPQFCVTNAGLQQLVIDYANKYLDENPDADMVPFDTADQAGWCTCPECAKLGDHSSQPFYLANIVGKAIQKTHPGKFVGVLAYSWHSSPPDFAMEPNVYIALTAGFNVGKYTFEELLKLWGEKCGTIGVYEYFSVWLTHKGAFPGGRAANVDDFGRRMQHYVASNVKGIIAEATSDAGLHGLGHYVAAKAMWDPSVDISLLKKDFYEKAFGPAAPVMERYFERVNQAAKPLPGRSLLLLCANDLEEATKLAKGQPAVLARVQDLKEFLIYNYLVQKIRMADPLGMGQPDQPALAKGETVENLDEQKKLTIDLLAWSYRTRANGMTQWAMTRSIVGRPASERYNDPSLFWRNTTDNPWRNREPVTADEVETRLKEMKADLGEVPTIEEVKFSDDLVLVKSGRQGEANSGKATFINSGADRSTYYALVSEKGEPIKLQVSKKGNPEAERPEARYTLQNSEGKEVLSGRFDNGDHELELRVPGPGIYTFTCNARDGWDITVPQAPTSALLVKRGERFMVSSLDAPLYFYVPKGTKEISMYPGDSGAMVVRDPLDKIVYDKTSSGGYVTIPVETGMDGKVWSLGKNQIRLNYFWFFNVPTVLSMNPEWILVPKEVAEKDGLEMALPK